MQCERAKEATLVKRVFLSHNSEDKPFARKIALYLKKYGIFVWIDEAEIKIGDSLTNKISKALEHVDYLVVLLSTNSVTSAWVNKELNIMMEKEIITSKTLILPVLIEKCSIPIFLRDKLYANVSEKRNKNREFKKLLLALGVDERNYDKTLFVKNKYTVIDFITKYNNSSHDYEKIDLLDDISVEDRDIFKYDVFRNFFSELLISKKQILTASIKMMSRLLTFSYPIDNDKSYISVMRNTYLNFFDDWIIIDDDEIAKVAIDSLTQIGVFIETQYDKVVQLIYVTKSPSIIASCKSYLLKVEYDSKNKRNKRHPLYNLLTDNKVTQKLISDDLIELIVDNWKSDPFGDSFFVLLHTTYVYGAKEVRHRIIREILYRNDLDNYISNPIYRKNFRDIFYDVMSSFDDYELKGRFLAYCLGKRTDVFDESDIFDALYDEHNEYTIEAFIDNLASYYDDYYYNDYLKELFVNQLKYYSPIKQKRWQKKLNEIFYDYDS